MKMENFSSNLDLTGGLHDSREPLQKGIQRDYGSGILQRMQATIALWRQKNGAKEEYFEKFKRKS